MENLSSMRLVLGAKKVGTGNLEHIFLAHFPIKLLIKSLIAYSYFICQDSVNSTDLNNSVAITLLFFAGNCSHRYNKF